MNYKKDNLNFLDFYTFNFSNKIENILFELDKLHQTSSLEEAINLIENTQKLAFKTLSEQEALIVSTY